MRCIRIPGHAPIFWIRCMAVMRPGFCAMAHRVLLGYFLIMLIVDEAHLLNISVRGDMHGRGIGRLLLDKVAQMARDKGMASILLEVRPSNVRAIRLYERFGFEQIGRRKAYYPAADNAREDAVVMRFCL